MVRETSMSAKQKLTLLTGVLFFLAISGISITAYLSFRKESVTNYETKLLIQSSLISRSLEERMKRIFDALELAAKDIELKESGLANEKKTLIKLENLKNQFSVLNAYIGLADGRTYSIRKNGIIKNFNAKEKKREWYIRAFRNEKRIITTPYKSLSQKIVMAVAVPVKREGSVVAVLSINLALDNLTKFISSLVEDNQVFVSREDGFLLAAKNKGEIGKDLFEIRPSYQQYKNSESAKHTDYFNDIEYFTVSYRIPAFNWTVWSWVPVEKILSASNNNLITTTIIAGTLMVLSMIIISRLINLFVYIPVGGEPKEIEKLVKQVSLGNLTLEERSTRHTTGVYSEVISMKGKLRKTILQINNTAESLRTTANKIMESSYQVNNGSKYQMEQIEHTADAMDEMAITAEKSSGAHSMLQSLLTPHIKQKSMVNAPSLI